MPTLTKRYVKKSREDFYCDDCNRLICKGSSYVYLFGMAEINDKPYSLRFCTSCNNEFERTIKGVKANE